MWKNMFWDSAMCLWLQTGGFAASLQLSTASAGTVETSWRRWLCCHSGLLARSWQCSWLRPQVCRLGLGCQQEGLAAQAQGGSHDLASIP